MTAMISWGRFLVSRVNFWFIAMGCDPGAFLGIVN